MRHRGGAFSINVFAGPFSAAREFLPPFLIAYTSGLFAHRPPDNRPSLIDWSRAVDLLAPLYAGGEEVTMRVAAHVWLAHADPLIVSLGNAVHDCLQQ